MAGKKKKGKGGKKPKRGAAAVAALAALPLLGCSTLEGFDWSAARIEVIPGGAAVSVGGVRVSVDACELLPECGTTEAEVATEATP